MRYFKVLEKTHIHVEDACTECVYLITNESKGLDILLTKVLSDEERFLGEEVVMKRGGLEIVTDEIVDELKGVEDVSYTYTVKEINSVEYVYMKNALVAYDYFKTNF